ECPGENPLPRRYCHESREGDAIARVDRLKTRVNCFEPRGFHSQTRGMCPEPRGKCLLARMMRSKPRVNCLQPRVSRSHQSTVPSNALPLLTANTHTRTARTPT